MDMMNLVNWEENTIINTMPSNLHEPSFTGLYLIWGETDYSWLNISPNKNFLSVLNWLIIWNNNTVFSSSLVVIGWGDTNKVNDVHNAWIGWGNNNQINSADNWAIGWGMNNFVAWSAWVVAWGNNNKASNWGVVVGWYNNYYNNEWVVLWWSDNWAWVNSVVLWHKNTILNSNSFLWKDNNDIMPVQSNVASITTDWVLIWTYEKKPQVALVVNWAVKLWNENEPTEKWEINNKEWCIRAWDGTHSHVLGKSSESWCGAREWCQFGQTLLQDGDSMVAYSSPYASDCSSKEIEVICNNWNLSVNPAYPSCYGTSLDPRNPNWH